PSVLLFNNDSHGTACSSYHAHSSLYGCCVQVRHLQLSDLLELCLCDRCDFVLVRHAGTGLDLACFLDQDCCRRCLCDEAEASVIVHCDNNRDDQVSLVCCPCIELLCKFNVIYAVLSKSRTNRRCRSCLAGRNL